MATQQPPSPAPSGEQPSVVKQVEKLPKLEKVEKIEKQEKLEKNEFKEHKDIKHEKLEKNEIKEHKDAKNEKHEKIEVKEHLKVEVVEKPPILEGPVGPGQPGLPNPGPVEGQQHFIAAAHRPDLSRGALKDEPDTGATGKKA